MRYIKQEWTRRKESTSGLTATTVWGKWQSTLETRSWSSRYCPLHGVKRAGEFTYLYLSINAEIYSLLRHRLLQHIQVVAWWGMDPILVNKGLFSFRLFRKRIKSQLCGIIVRSAEDTTEEFVAVPVIESVVFSFSIGHRSSWNKSETYPTWTKKT